MNLVDSFPTDAPDEPDHALSAELILARAAAVSNIATTYAGPPGADVSPAERRKLAEAAELVDRALDRFT
jgi:hypothetical protein